MSDHTLNEEIRLEQQHVNRVYARLARLRADAQRAEAEGYQLARVGNFGSLVERDAMVFHAARRRHIFDAEHEGLVFGRLDMRPDAVSPPGTSPTSPGNGTASPDASTDAVAAPADGAASPDAVSRAGGETADAPDDASPNGASRAGGEKAPEAASAAGAAQAAVEDARDSAETRRYIGRLGLRDEDGEPLLIDWRAPAAEPFYRATAARPLGVIRRRMITSFGEKVMSLDDDLLDPEADAEGIRVVGDGALMAALSRSKGTGMRDIVATIQHEQDLAIRAPASGVTVVEGGPGTGKTAVALHRAAFLLYTDRARFAGGGVLIVGPSPVFVRYIETVLPALGEDSATLASLGQLVPGIAATREETAMVRAIKGSLKMRRLLRRAADDAPPSVPDGLRIRYRGEWLVLTKRQTEDIRRRVGRGSKRNEVRAKAFGEVLDLLWETYKDVLRIEQSRFDEELSDHDGFRDFLRAWWPLLTPRQVFGWLGEPRRLRRYADGVFSPQEQRVLAQSIKAEPSIDDVALLDELTELLGHQPKPKRRRPKPAQTLGVAPGAAQRESRAADYRDYAHVVVDESQDVTPMQWRMIGRRGHAASWTIVGDPAQSAWIGDAAEPGRARDEAVGRRQRHEHRLTTNYRNSAEIFAVAAEVIRAVRPDLPLPVAVRSTGIDPVHHLIRPEELEASIKAAVADLREEVEGTIAVIVPDAGVRDRFRKEEDERTSVVTALAAKGMEYDAVVLVEPGRLQVSTRYVALSRATQRLITIATAAWRERV